MSGETTTPTVRGAGSKTCSHGLMTDVFVFLAFGQSGSSGQVFAYAYIAKGFGSGSVSLEGDYACAGFEVGLRSIFAGDELNHAVVDTVVSKPAETHTRMRVAVDGGHHAIGFFFAHQFVHTVIHSLNVGLGHVVTGFGHCDTKGSITRNGVLV